VEALLLKVFIEVCDDLIRNTDDLVLFNGPLQDAIANADHAGRLDEAFQLSRIKSEINVRFHRRPAPGQWRPTTS
jgi:hypothetical protein